jgi:hypothetical protein
MTAEILTQEFIKSLLHYDPETGIFLWLPRTRSQFPSDRAFKRWNTQFCLEQAGSLQDGKYRLIPIKGHYYKAHRLAWVYIYGYWPDQIDHINHAFDDNRIINLRNISNTENHRNKPPYKNNKSGVPGVFWRSDTKKWRVYIYVNERLKHLGSFIDKDEAVRVRQAAIEKYGFHENHGRVLQSGNEVLE